MSPSTSPATPARSFRAAAAAAAVLVLAACGASPEGDAATTGPAADATRPASAPATSDPATSPAPTSPASPGPAGPTGSPSTTAPSPATSAPAELVTYSGEAAGAAFSFRLPATWAVEEEFTDVGGSATIAGPDGAPLASLTVLTVWGAECPPGCPEPPVVHLGDVPGEGPLSRSGDFVVRTVTMDLTDRPDLRETYRWEDAVRLVTSLTDAEVPVPATMMPHVMYGVGLVGAGTSTGGPDDGNQRVVVFSAEQEFATPGEASAYAGSEEHRQLQQMIASFRG